MGKTRDIFPSYSFWQSEVWAHILEQSGQVMSTETFLYEGETILVEYRSIGLGFFAAFSLGVSERCIAGLATALRDKLQKGTLFYQAESYSHLYDDATTLGKTYGKAFIEPWTRVIDLTKPLDDILSLMHEKGRYNVRLATKRGITTEWVSPTEENIDIWMGLLSETTTRDGFSKNSRAYYQTFLSFLAQENLSGLLFAKVGDRVIAAGIFVFFGDTALYYYGASTSDVEMRKHMAPYLLQWDAIREGKSRGCLYYDFLGVAPPLSYDHHLAGVTSFKEKFGGEVVMISRKQITIISPVRYFVYSIIRFIKNIPRKR